MSEIHVPLTKGLETQLHTVSGGGKTEGQFFRELPSSKDRIFSFDTEKNFRIILVESRAGFIKRDLMQF